MNDAANQISENQRQTEGAFGFKWHQLDSFDTEHSNDIMRRWLLEKYCDGSESMVEGWLSPGGKIVVDAGCGAGLSASLLFGARLNAHHYLGIDISTAVEVARQRFQKLGISGEFLQADLQNVGLPDAAVDVMFSEGVLHHTDDTGAAIRKLARSIKPGGLFIFYVYRKKGPIREFTDDYVREHLRGMSDQGAWNALIPLTKLGQALGRLNVQVEIPEDIPILQIGKGTVDVQRLFYWHVMKVYYREEMSIEEMNHINFDWFRPLNCHRHTAEEIREFCRVAGLRIDRLHEQESGFSVIATRAGA
jgi:ubiquinone/menaquinone biosynthesis C-methylase UbiE